MSDAHDTQFFSRHHPGTLGLVAAFLRAYARPLPYVLLPLMIVALSVALQGGAVDPFLLVYFPLAFAGAAAWTFFDLYRQVVEVRVDALRGVCLRTAWEILRGTECRWMHVHGLRYGAPWITFAWGRTAIELNGNAWPREPELLDALRMAAELRTPQFSS